MKKVTLIILFTLVVNLIGHNLHPYFGAKLFYYCEYVNYAVLYMVIYYFVADFTSSFYARFLCGVGVIFSINDIVDLMFNPYKSHLHEWIVCLIASVTFYFYLKNAAKIRP